MPNPNTTEDVLYIVYETWKQPFTTRSDIARTNAELIAVASSLNYITTAVLPEDISQHYGKIWRVTPKGLTKLWERKVTPTCQD